jgi:hypothetical protein
MRYITIPADIIVTPHREIAPDARPEAVSFKKYALNIWLNDERATQGAFTRLVRWSHVIDAFDAVKAGDVLALEDEDYATLRSIAEQPKAFFPPTIAVRLLPFTQAVLDAPETKPSNAASSKTASP